MALKDSLKGFFDTALADVFDKKEVDPSTLRKPLLKGIDNAAKQFENGQTKAPNRWWKVSNNVVALTVKVGGDILQVNGQDTNHLPSERFPEFLTKFKAAVEGGEFDDELKGGSKGQAKVATPRKKREGASSAGTGWSQTRRDAFAATIAARNAAKSS